MNHCGRQSNINVVNPITKLPTEQLIVRNLLERKDLIKDKAFLRCSIQDWDNITKLYNQQLGTHVLYFVAMLLAEALEEAGTANGLLCHSDGDDFTIIDLATVIPKVRENLEQRFTPEVLAQEPVYIARIRKLIDGDKIPAALQLITKLITAEEFFQMEKHQGNEAS